MKDKPLAHKIITILSVLISVAVIILALLQIFDIWSEAVYIFIPLTGISQLCQAYMQWNVNRKVSYFNLGTAAFIFVCSAVVFFVK